ncbi:uncharacterized protein STEHIDRAFT_124211 [Stereum hirsutum FP-91666 SS1]|uniref:uncharacterized protein n=1 Tax=Stereum hirsutum (strain FP-91666) TaxID=721885 RepID=UPI000444A7A2|nr:uncharacterized protein STEHIDRAFT_124211 [Stereum hirsutum FP-91666 SS1]EIM82878.1 hypothetical protein STEHIDRAFT_124211 [Stereum hirsutum FP-91666 SS1]
MYPGAIPQPSMYDGNSLNTVDYGSFINFHEEQPEYAWDDSASPNMKTTNSACGDHYAGDYYNINSANEQQYAIDPSSTSYDNSAYVASSGNVSEYGSMQENYVPTGYDMYGTAHYAEPVTYGYPHSVESAVNYTSYPPAAIPVQDHQECGTDYFPPPLTQVPIPPINLIPCPAASSEFLQYSGRADYSSADHPHHREHREHRVEHVSGDRARLHIHVSSGPPASSSHTRTRKVTRSPLELACYFCRGRKIACGWPEGAEVMDQSRCYECYRREQDCRYPSVRVSAMPHSRVLTSRLRSRVVDNEGF